MTLGPDKNVQHMHPKNVQGLTPNYVSATSPRFHSPGLLFRQPMLRRSIKTIPDQRIEPC
jgi:hypothetical protein